MIKVVKVIISIYCNKPKIHIIISGVNKKIEKKLYTAHTGDAGSIPGLGRSPGEGNGNPLQYSCLGNPWTGEPGGLQSRGTQRVGHSLETEHTCIQLTQ